MARAQLEIVIQDLRDLRERVDRCEQSLAEIKGSMKLLAMLTPLAFTALNLLLHVLGAVR